MANTNPPREPAGAALRATRSLRAGGSRLGHPVEMPARVQPLPVAPDEHLGETPAHRALRATGLDHRFVAPVEHDDVAEPLRPRFRKRQTDESTAPSRNARASSSVLARSANGASFMPMPMNSCGSRSPSAFTSPAEIRPPRRFARGQHLLVDRRVRRHVRTGRRHHRREQRDPEHACRRSNSLMNPPGSQSSREQRRGGLRFLANSMPGAEIGARSDMRTCVDESRGSAGPDRRGRAQALRPRARRGAPRPGTRARDRARRELRGGGLVPRADHGRLARDRHGFAVRDDAGSGVLLCARRGPSVGLLLLGVVLGRGGGERAIVGHAGRLARAPADESSRVPAAGASERARRETRRARRRSPARCCGRSRPAPRGSRCSGPIAWRGMRRASIEPRR